MGEEGWRKDFGWTWAAPGSRPKTAICIFCNKECHGGVSRLKFHLGGIKSKGILTCTKAPTEVKEKCQTWWHEVEHGVEAKKARTEHGVEAKKARTEQSFQQFVSSAGVGVQSCFEGSSNAGSGSSSTPQSTTNPLFHVSEATNIFPSFTTLGSQPTIEGMGSWNKDVHEFARKMIASWFYACAIPFNASRSPLYQKMFDAVITAGAGFKAPTYNQVRGPILDDCANDIDKLLEEHRNTWEKYGCSIMADGWTTFRGRTLINFLVASKKGTIFIKSVDASDHVKRSDYLLNLYEETMKFVGEKNVVQFITDNASNYVKAGEELMKRHPSIYWTPCAAHCLDLLLEDLSKIEHITEAINGAKQICQFVYNHGTILSLVKKYTEGKDLVRPATTRFATHFLTLRSLESKRLQLMQAFASESWLHGEDFLQYRTSLDGKEISELVYNNAFWEKVSESVKVVEPLAYVLRIVDGDNCPMAKIYEVMDIAKEAIANFYNNDRGKYKPIWDIIDQRWNNQLHRPMHAAAHHLNPRIVYAKEGVEYEPDIEISLGFHDTLEKLVPDLDEQELICKQLCQFVKKEGVLFNKPLVQRQIHTVSADQWWELWGTSTPELRKLALKIYSQPCSASGCERNWSAFEHIYTKKRTKLTMQRLDKLVYVYYNMKIGLRVSSSTENDNMDLDALVDMLDDDHRVSAIMEWISDVPNETSVDPDHSTRRSLGCPSRYLMSSRVATSPPDIGPSDIDFLERSITEEQAIASEETRLIQKSKLRTRGGKTSRR